MRAVRGAPGGPFREYEMDFLAEYYQLLRALHFIALISWMAAIFYLPRLFVYHSRALIGGEHSEALKIMEHKLARVIMTPAMISTFIFGLALAMVPGVLAPPSGWFHAKLVCVLLMAGFHGFLVKSMRRFKQDERPYSEKTFRFLNEVPTVLMILIIILVVFKPF